MKKTFVLLIFAGFITCLSARTKADSLLRATSQLSKTFSISDTTAATRMNLMSPRYRKAGKLDTAALLAKRAMEIAELLIPSKINAAHLVGIREKAISLNNLGLIETERSNFPVAIEYLLKSNKLRDEMGDVEGMAVVFHNIANIHIQTKNYDLALDFYNKARIINEKLGLKYNLSKNLNSLGMAHMMKDDFTKAKSYYNQAMNLKLELNDVAGLAYVYANFGEIETKNGKFADALYWYNKSLETARKQKSTSPIITGLACLTAGLCDLKRFDEAEPVVKEAYSMATQTSAFEILPEILMNWSRIDSAKGNFKNAYLHYKEYKLLQDSVDGDESARKVLQQQMQYDYEKKDALNRKEQEKKDLITAKEIQAQKTQRNYLLIGLVAMGLLIGFVYKIYHDKKKSSKELQLKNDIIEEKQKEILDSIRYAKRIQQSLLPHEKTLERELKRLRKK